MFERTRSRRRRSRERAHVETVLRDAQSAAETARAAFRPDGREARKGAADEALIDVIQAAILGSITPSLGTVQSDAGAPRPQRNTGTVFLVGLAVGIGIAAWARREPDDDDPSDGSTASSAGFPSARATKAMINSTLDRADGVIRRAVDVTAGAMGSAVEAVADAASPTAERVSGQLKVARRKATSEVIRALDDIQDVWGDDDDTMPVPVTKKGVSRAATAQKPTATPPPPVRKRSTGARPTSNGGAS